MKYTPRFTIGDCIVSKSQIKRLFELFQKRFPKRNHLAVTVKFRDQEQDVYSLAEFDEFINGQILPNNEEISSIYFLAYKNDARGKRKLASLQIRFDPAYADFYSEAEGSQLKDWVYGFQKDIKDLCQSYSPQPELVSELKKQFPNKYSRNVVFFDYNGDFTKTIMERKKTRSLVNIQNSQFSFGKGDNVGRDKISKHEQIIKESFVEKFFWYVVVALAVGVCVIIIADKLKIGTKGASSVIEKKTDQIDVKKYQLVSFII